MSDCFRYFAYGDRQDGMHIFSVHFYAPLTSLIRFRGLLCKRICRSLTTTRQLTAASSPSPVSSQSWSQLGRRIIIAVTARRRHPLLRHATTKEQMSLQQESIITLAAPLPVGVAVTFSRLFPISFTNIPRGSVRESQSLECQDERHTKYGKHEHAELCLS